MAITPQFPLGTVLFPSMVLPLHIFEPRYRTMIEDVNAGDGVFGVVLIERGNEVGGDDQRTGFGTLARVVEAEQFSDGRWAVITVGIERFRVDRWLPDDPYPRAEITPWPDTSAGSDVHGRYERVVAKFRRCMALAAESGLNVGTLPDTFDDVELGCMQMSAMAPVTSLDKQRLLGAPGPAERIELLDELLSDATELIEVRLTDS
ncbi:MAG: LON peptidase substrate-binding domain-containing protein [Acidimicrobiia bacterium]|nr:LON peptidase substrate-binding domain-containing protein [Acidimicrobiia bacterium]